MKTIARFIQRHPILSYYILTFTISWGLVLIMIVKNGMPATMVQLDAQLPIAIVAMLGGPSISGILMIGLVSGKAGFRELRSRLLKWRVGIGWYVLAIMVGPAVVMTTPLALWLTSPAYSPNIIFSGIKTSLIVMAVVSALVTGFCEELGWTGFVVPLFRLRYGIFATGLIMGAIWGLWHVLANDIWALRTYGGNLSPALTATLIGISFLFGQLPAFRVLLVWIYDRTGSLPVVMLTHAGLSAASIIIGSLALPGILAFVCGLLMPPIAIWIIIAGVTSANGGKLPRHVVTT
jgi:uncharacterized protein